MHDLYDVGIKRPDILNSYFENMVTYLHLMRPNDDIAKIREFVRNKLVKINNRLVANLKEARRKGESPENYKDCWPTVRMIRNSVEGSTEHSYGNITEYPDYDLFKWVKEFNSKIISPFGTYYETVDHNSSFLKGMVDMKKAERKSEKKLMLLAKKEGNRTAETFHNNNQATIKINMNSYIGAMGSGFNNMSSIANFNSVTSIARFFIMNSYGHAERFLESNFYFRTEEQLINFIITCVECGPSDEVINRIMSENSYIRYPSVQEVTDFFINCLRRYDSFCDTSAVVELISKLSKERLCFMFYMSNMKQLVFKNDKFFREWVKDLFSMENVDMVACEAKDVNKLDGDLAIVVSTVYNDLLPRNAKGNNISIYDCINEAPEIAKKMYCIGLHMQAKMNKLRPIFDLFMDHEVAIGYVVELKNQYRDAIVVSDTDSIIFTTKSWVEWYTGTHKISTDAFNINALIVYWLSKANANILYHVSKNFGALKKDMLTMAMKNEFMMPVEILTSLKKHYASILKIQEGVFYATPRMDIKGVNLRGSNFSKGVLNYAEWFIKSLIDDIYEHGTVDPRKKILEVLRFERMISDSLKRGETQFLPVEPVKMKEEYAEPEKSIYFNYLFWEEVFGDKYGHIQLPTKCFVVPLLGVKNVKFIEQLKSRDEAIGEKWQKYVSSATKDINRIPINPITNKIPEEIIPISDFRSIVYSNTKSMYLIMQSLGITSGISKGKVALYSDLYGWVSEEEGKLALEHTV